MKRSNSTNTLRDGLDVGDLNAMAISVSNTTADGDTSTSPIPNETPSEGAPASSSSNSNATPPTTNNGPTTSPSAQNTSSSSGANTMPPNNLPTTSASFGVMNATFGSSTIGFGSNAPSTILHSSTTSNPSNMQNTLNQGNTTNQSSIFVPPSVSRYRVTPRTTFNLTSKCVIPKELRPSNTSELRKLRENATQSLTNKFKLIYPREASGAVDAD